MKGRESGMPDEAYWTTFFDAEAMLDRLLPADGRDGDAVEFGCGYGTFTLPAARRMGGIVSALDIEPEMVAIVAGKAAAAQLDNIRPALRDFVAAGTGLADGLQRHALIFNLLHLEAPLALLREAHRVLAAGGSLSVIHWRSDIPTPRGPSLAIRPTPEACREWLVAAGFTRIDAIDLADCAPYHYGLVGRR